jgi:hypothetical protein
MPLVQTLVKSLACRVLEDTLLYLLYVVTLGLFIAALLMAVERMVRLVRDHPRRIAKHRHFSKGLNR